MEGGKVNKGKVKSCNRINDEDRSLSLVKMKYKGFGRVIFKIYIT